jgi:DNA-binding MarR family transcriptional regulator
MKIITDLEQYLHDLLNIECAPVLWVESRKLPLFLRSEYSYYQISLLGANALLMIDKKTAEQTPANIKKQVEGVREKCQWEVIYVCEAISSTNRNRLIGQKVSFIVPGNQMYLPLLGLDLREHFRNIIKAKTFLSPSAQAFLLYVLYHKEKTQFSPKETAISMGYTPMTMTRSFDELEVLGIGEHTKIGKDRFVTFRVHGKELWEQAKPFMKSPIKKKITLYDQIPKGGFIAGISALASKSMIAETSKPVYAFSADKWKEIKLKESKNIYNETAEIEIWSYLPSLFSVDNKVDALSLFLSMQEDPDERVQSALVKMMEEFKW